MNRILIILCFLLLSVSMKSYAQRDVAYTSGNTILIGIEGTTGFYEYTTNQMLVRFNKNTRNVECLFNVNTLLPANDSSPVVIAQDIFFAAKFPEFLIEIDAPEGTLYNRSAAPQADNRRARIHFQGVPVERDIPVNFLADNRTLLFSTSFDMLLPDYQITVPARYIPMLTGRITFTIRNAQWTVLEPR